MHDIQNVPQSSFIYLNTIQYILVTYENTKKELIYFELISLNLHTQYITVSIHYSSSLDNILIKQDRKITKQRT